jgi:hypothetical protein
MTEKELIQIYYALTTTFGSEEGRLIFKKLLKFITL